MLKLTALSDACAGMTAVCKTQHRFITAIERYHTLLSETTHEKAEVLPGYAGPELEALSFLKCILEGIEGKINYTDASARGQVQTMYSLLNQKDSRTQIASAEASMQIAYDSKEMVILTRKDSTDMRIIAAVTLIFLPGTFTATLFSSTFFNFQASRSPRMVSRWIWLYWHDWVLTVALTLAVLVAWWYFATMSHRKMEAFRRESEKEIQSRGLGFRSRLRDRWDRREAVPPKPYLGSTFPSDPQGMSKASLFKRHKRTWRMSSKQTPSTGPEGALTSRSDIEFADVFQRPVNFESEEMVSVK
ncbi:hypothetical protein K402DRAFT_21420 [Aulographum hederae CBS 113979]|uniref:Uncharacterized protein n=1 Tax=Aulographum hederae CBS 113979 TaxID=1176131 RepID=A0A6G1H6K9_9PEZI|nr:hypothetical protein K402DRAFT_21420 [Aulographum hederae CBS 113979]